MVRQISKRWRSAQRLKGRGAGTGPRSAGERSWATVYVGGFVLHLGRDGITMASARAEPEAIQRVRLADALEATREETHKALHVEPPAAPAGERAPKSAIDAADALRGKTEDLTRRLERLNELRELLANGMDVESVAEELDGLLEVVLERYQSGRYRDVVRLARLLAGALVLAYRWRELVELLNLALAAARLAGDLAGEGWATHEIGVLAGAAGSETLAAELLASARDRFEQTGEHAAAEVSTRNLGQVVPTGPPAPGGLAEAGRWVARHKIAAASAAAAGAIGAGLAIQLIDAAPDAQITSFTTASALPVPGTFDQRRGLQAPADAVDPGATLRACDPLYVVGYIHFSDMAVGTRSTVQWSANGRRWSRANSFTWSDPSDFGWAGWAFSFDEEAPDVSSGTSVPPGQWQLTVRIEDEIRDQAAVTVTNTCR